MKKYVRVLIAIFFFIIFTPKISAAPSASLSVNGSVTSGQKFTISLTIKNFTSAQYSIQGIGNVASGCSLSNILQAENGENMTKTFSLTCVANSPGIINISYSVKALDKSYAKKEFSDSKTIKVVPPREKDTNNELKSLSVKDFEISPAFDKDTLEYTVNVPSTIDSVTISATAVSIYSNISGTGDQEVQEGANVFEIKVVSESGKERIYKVNVIVEDPNPISIDIGGTKYTIIKNVKNIEAPELFTESTFNIEDTEVPAYLNETTQIKLIAVKDETGKVFFARCHEDGSFSLYQPLKSYGMHLILLEPTDVLNGFEKQTIQMNGQEVIALVHGNIKIVYAKNLETNEDDFYLYDEKNMTYAKYSNDMVEELLEKNQLMNYILIGLSAGMGFIFFLMLILLCKKKPKQKVVKKEEVKEEKVQEEKKIEETPKKKGKKQKEKVIEEKEEVPTEVVEEPKIEEIPNEETPKIIETVEEMEEEFYSILEDKPMKRPKK